MSKIMRESVEREATVLRAIVHGDLGLAATTLAEVTPALFLNPIYRHIYESSQRSVAMGGLDFMQHEAAEVGRQWAGNAPSEIHGVFFLQAPTAEQTTEAIHAMRAAFAVDSTSAN